MGLGDGIAIRQDYGIFRETGPTGHSENALEPKAL
jgi:hypothetical protein